MIPRSQRWRPVRHPLGMTTRKRWRWAQLGGALISPRGTIFLVRFLRGGMVAKRWQEFQLKDA